MFKMEKKTYIYWLSSFLVIIFILLGSLGVLIFPGFLNFLGISYISFPKAIAYEIHHLLGILFIILIVIHLINHRRWIYQIFKKISIIKNTNFFIIILLIFVLLILILTGIIKYPGLLPFFEISISDIPYKEISLLHDWSGISAIILAIIHVGLFFKRREKLSKNTRENKLQ
jgi:hypothetical protein